MACQSAINGTFKNMSLLKTKLPGLLPKVECVPAHMACIMIDNASSINFLALAPVACCGGWPCSSVLNAFPTVWCMCSHIALACGFLLVVWMSLILQLCSENWTSGPMNLPPLSWIHCTGHRYHESQTCAYFLDVLSSILTSSTRLDTVSIIIRALNSYGLSRTWIIQGPNKSAAHFSNEMDWISHSGKCPYTLPSSLLCWQWSQW